MFSGRKFSSRSSRYVRPSRKSLLFTVVEPTRTYRTKIMDLDGVGSEHGHGACLPRTTFIFQAFVVGRSRCAYLMEPMACRLSEVTDKHFVGIVLRVRPMRPGDSGGITL